MKALTTALVLLGLLPGSVPTVADQAGGSRTQPPSATPLSHGSQNLAGVTVRVVDVGAGLCCIAVIPGADRKHYMVYDAGNYEDDGDSAIEAIREVIEGETIDYLVLSHSDSDHLGAVPRICDEYTVQNILRTGLERSTRTWRDADAAIKLEEEEGAWVANLSEIYLAPGSTFSVGDAFLTMVCGFGTAPEEWGLTSTSHKRNAVSIVVRLYYKGKSVLFCGDAVGRHIGHPADECIATEKYMVDRKDVISIDSDVLIAPHH